MTANISALLSQKNYYYGFSLQNFSNMNANILYFSISFTVEWLLLFQIWNFGKMAAIISDIKSEIDKMTANISDLGNW